MKHISEYDTEQRYQATILRSERLTPQGTDEIRELVLEVNHPKFKCEVDQSFGVLLPTDRQFGESHHHRLYSVADVPKEWNGKTHLTMLVKRCDYIDEFNGERYKGLSSNFLCDSKIGEKITLTGPFELPFRVPKDKTANLLLIGMGTGIAPFRAFIKHIYSEEGDWRGKVRLFFGAKSGLELLYMNDKDGDLTQYYDRETFEAFTAVSPRPQWADPISLDTTIEQQADEIREMLASSNTYVYVGGYGKVKENLDKAFANILGGEEEWLVRKSELIAGKKWAEVIY
ncbi:ferredoxin reductase domain-containing protein [Sediminitomix flava]|uniref:Ferredoxin--NADP+ reductase n=1 Tax=Sediminitomix flava TaxID=379075 RepID=A0A315ZHL0_SEDFL|nr:ferredoxin-NADP reductase [Sediminitomix flava]PWJ44640.1 ferredoxin--NADP+ reductase [Sediminitomix flava]